MQHNTTTDTATTANSGDNDVKETFWQPLLNREDSQEQTEPTTVTPEMVSNKRNSHAAQQASHDTDHIKLTRKQKAFTDGILNNPKASATEIAAQVYGVSNRETAAVIASENLRKPNIQAYLDKQGYNSVLEIVDIAQTAKRLGSTGDKAGAAYIAVALAANRDIADRAYGKATARTEVVSTKVSINLDLTSAS